MYRCETSAGPPQYHSAEFLRVAIAAWKSVHGMDICASVMFVTPGRNSEHRLDAKSSGTSVALMCPKRR